jgi:hypothetical protein
MVIGSLYGSGGKSMAQQRGSIIGAVGAVLMGSAILLFVATIVLNSLKDANGYADTVAGRADWNASNATIAQIQQFLTVAVILLSVLGIVMVGASIISYIGGAFGA